MKKLFRVLRVLVILSVTFNLAGCLGLRLTAFIKVEHTASTNTPLFKKHVKNRLDKKIINIMRSPNRELISHERVIKSRSYIGMVKEQGHWRLKKHPTTEIMVKGKTVENIEVDASWLWALIAVPFL